MAKIDFKTIKLTKEEKSLLTKNKAHLISAALSNYTLPVLQKDLIAMNDLYVRQLKGQPFSLSCPRCQIKLLSVLYQLAKEQELI